MDMRSFQEGRVDPREIAMPALILVLVLIAGFLAFASIYTVQPSERAVVLRFGKLHTTAQPGLHFCIPLVDRILKVDIREQTLRMPAGSEAVGSSRRMAEEETLMLTGDLNAASVEWTVQWKVTKPEEYLFSFYDPYNPDYIEQVVMTATQTVMNRLVGDYSIDEVLTEKRTEIDEDARKATQAILDGYQCGVAITALQMQRVTPPAKVKPAFDAVNSAIQERDKLVNEANKERYKLLYDARAERDKKIQEARGYADNRRLKVEGEIEALRARYQAYEHAPEITRRRLYLEGMQEILGGVETKVIIDSELKQVLPLLQLDEGGQR
jgi:modulator of FtsH protease HflK